MSNLEKQSVEDVVRNWDEAMTTNNALEIGKFMADDWMIVGSDGISSKAAFLEMISSGVLTHHIMASDEMIVRMEGATAIVISKGTSAGTYNGQEFSLYEWSTNVFRKAADSWICSLTMLTPAKK